MSEATATAGGVAQGAIHPLDDATALTLTGEDQFEDYSCPSVHLSP